MSPDCRIPFVQGCLSFVQQERVSLDWLRAIDVTGDVVIGLTAILALAVALWQLRVQRRHNRLSVEPHLLFKSSLGFENWAIELQNRGLGPAIITTFNVRCGDRVWKSVSECLAELLPEFRAIARPFLEQHECLISVELGNIPVGTRYPVGFADFVIKIEKKRELERNSAGVIGNAEFITNRKLDELFLQSFGNLVFEYEYADVYQHVIERKTQAFWRAPLDFLDVLS